MKRGSKSARPAGGAQPKTAAPTPPPARAPAPGKAAAAAKGSPSEPKKAAAAEPPPKREEPWSVPATFLVLGGYGTVGSAICHTILQQSSTATVLVAGRGYNGAKALCSRLNAEFPGNKARAVPLVADASDAAALKEQEIQKFDVIINATTMRAVEGVITLMRFAASKRASYIDLRGPIGLEGAIAKAVGDVGPVVLMGCGYCPGAIAPLLKTAATKLTTCSVAHLSIAATALPSQAEEAIEAMMAGTRLEDWRDGSWEPAYPSQPTFKRSLDFGDGMIRQTTPVSVSEVRTIPEELGLSQCSVRFSSTQDGGLMCAAMAVLCCAPCVGLREGIAKHLRAAMERQAAKEPNLCAFVCEATGSDKEGMARKVVLRASHPGGSAAMAAHCVVAQLTQILTNTISGGVPPRLCGTAVDADKLLGALIKQGVKVSIETIDGSEITA